MKKKKILKMLKNPGVVWSWMLRGDVARPTMFEHYYELKAEVERQERIILNLTGHPRAVCNEIDVTNLQLGNWKDYLSWRRKAPIIHAIRMIFPEGFMVVTEGYRSFGEAGDYLVVDEYGMRTVVPKETFEREYEVVV